MITDLDYLKKLSDGDEQFIREMVDIFREQIAEYTELMPQLLEKADYDSLSKLAHKAKSSVAVMGMTSDAESLKELELHTREGKNPERYEEYVNRFISRCKQALDELAEIY